MLKFDESRGDDKEEGAVNDDDDDTDTENDADVRLTGLIRCRSGKLVFGRMELRFSSLEFSGSEKS